MVTVHKKKKKKNSANFEYRTLFRFWSEVIVDTTKKLTAQFFVSFISPSPPRHSSK